VEYFVGHGPALIWSQQAATIDVMIETSGPPKRGRKKKCSRLHTEELADYNSLSNVKRAPPPKGVKSKTVEEQDNNNNFEVSSKRNSKPCSYSRMCGRKRAE